jgi:hypothetical protein
VLAQESRVVQVGRIQMTRTTTGTGHDFKYYRKYNDKIESEWWNMFFFTAPYRVQTCKEGVYDFLERDDTVIGIPWEFF